MLHTLILNEQRLNVLHDCIDQGLIIARIIQIQSDLEDQYVTVIDCDQGQLLWFYLQ